LNDLVGTQFALSKDAVDKSDWDFANGVTQCSCADHHLHLEDIPFGQGDANDVAKDVDSIQSIYLTVKLDSAWMMIIRIPETASEVADTGSQDGVSEEVGASADKLPFEIPSVHAAWSNACIL